MTYLLCAWLLPKIKVNREFRSAESGIEVFVKSNGVHTDIVVPAKHKQKNWTRDFIPESFEEVDSTFQYISIGWGDKGFYLNTPTWADLKFSTAFKAAFFMSSTAMHITYLKRQPRECDKCKKLVLSEEQYGRLINFISSSFALNEKGIQRIEHPGYNEYDNFYEAKGTYSFIKTCNVWTCDALKASGVKVGCWTPLESGLLESVE